MSSMELLDAPRPQFSANHLPQTTYDLLFGQPWVVTEPAKPLPCHPNSVDVKTEMPIHPAFTTSCTYPNSTTIHSPERIASSLWNVHRLCAGGNAHLPSTYGEECDPSLPTDAQPHARMPTPTAPLLPLNVNTLMWNAPKGSDTSTVGPLGTPCGPNHCGGANAATKPPSAIDDLPAFSPLGRTPIMYNYSSWGDGLRLEASPVLSFGCNDDRFVMEPTTESDAPEHRAGDLRHKFDACSITENQPPVARDVLDSMWANFRVESRDDTCATSDSGTTLSSCAGGTAVGDPFVHWASDVAHMPGRVGTGVAAQHVTQPTDGQQEVEPKRAVEPVSTSTAWQTQLTRDAVFGASRGPIARSEEPLVCNGATSAHAMWSSLGAAPQPLCPLGGAGHRSNSIRHDAPPPPYHSAASSSSEVAAEVVDNQPVCDSSPSVVVVEFKLHRRVRVECHGIRVSPGQNVVVCLTHSASGRALLQATRARAAKGLQGPGMTTEEERSASADIDVGLCVAVHGVGARRGGRRRGGKLQGGEVGFVLRVANGEDTRIVNEVLPSLEQHALERCQQLAHFLHLPFACVDAEYQYDRKSVVIYYSLEPQMYTSIIPNISRLQRELTFELKARVTLHQLASPSRSHTPSSTGTTTSEDEAPPRYVAAAPPVWPST